MLGREHSEFSDLMKSLQYARLRIHSIPLLKNPHTKVRDLNHSTPVQKNIIRCQMAVKQSKTAQTKHQ
jgi:hypothetical protein